MLVIGVGDGILYFVGHLLDKGIGMNKCKHENLKEQFHGDRRPIIYCTDCGLAYRTDGTHYALQINSLKWTLYDVSK